MTDIGLRLSDLQCDLKEECDKVQGELVEILRKENVRCDSEKISEIQQGECLEKSEKVNVKNVRCAKDRGEENCLKVQCERSENV